MAATTYAQAKDNYERALNELSGIVQQVPCRGHWQFNYCRQAPGFACRDEALLDQFMTFSVHNGHDDNCPALANEDREMADDEKLGRQQLTEQSVIEANFAAGKVVVLLHWVDHYGWQPQADLTPICQCAHEGVRTLKALREPWLKHHSAAKDARATWRAAEAAEQAQKGMIEKQVDAEFTDKYVALNADHTALNAEIETKCEDAASEQGLPRDAWDGKLYRQISAGFGDRRQALKARHAALDNEQEARKKELLQIWATTVPFQQPVVENRAQQAAAQ
jgi:hypothetical protein